MPGEGEGLGEELGSSAPADPGGEPLGPVTVVPNGVGETAGETDVPGTGVTVAGTEVGLGVAVGGGGGGVGGGVGVGAGVGAVTTIGVTETGSGFNPLSVVPVNVAVQLPTGSVLDAIQV